MNRCEHFIDIRPYDPLCDHPLRTSGGGPSIAACDSCPERIKLLTEDNDKLLSLVKMLHRLAYWADVMDMAEKTSLMNQVNRIVWDMGIFEPDDSWRRILEDATALGAQMGRRTAQVDDLVARCEALAAKPEQYLLTREAWERLVDDLKKMPPDDRE